MFVSFRFSMCADQPVIGGLLDVESTRSSAVLVEGGKVRFSMMVVGKSCQYTHKILVDLLQLSQGVTGR